MLNKTIDILNNDFVGFLKSLCKFMISGYNISIVKQIRSNTGINDNNDMM